MIRILRYIVRDPRDAAYALPRRAACHLFGWHNITCRGLPAPHPRNW